MDVGKKARNKTSIIQGSETVVHIIENRRTILFSYGFPVAKARAGRSGNCRLSEGEAARTHADYWRIVLEDRPFCGQRWQVSVHVFPVEADQRIVGLQK
jgi:hypothetical protein